MCVATAFRRKTGGQGLDWSSRIKLLNSKPPNLALLVIPALSTVHNVHSASSAPDVLFLGTHFSNLVMPLGSIMGSAVRSSVLTLEADRLVDKKVAHARVAGGKHGETNDDTCMNVSPRAFLIAISQMTDQEGSTQRGSCGAVVGVGRWCELYVVGLSASPRRGWREPIFWTLSGGPSITYQLAPRSREFGLIRDVAPDMDSAGGRELTGTGRIIALVGCIRITLVANILNWFLSGDRSVREKCAEVGSF